MMSSKHVFSTGLFFLIASVAFASVPKTASANVDSSSLLESACSSGPDHYRELSELKRRIAAAETIERARTLALAPTDEAIGALKNARTLMPFSDPLRTAERHLINTRSRILLASSQEQVADEFSGMLLAALDNDRAAHVGVGKVSCNYSTGEVIAIVVGLILGIIPGLILLVVLC